jgi:hypothetical protein
VFLGCHAVSRSVLFAGSESIAGGRKGAAAARETDLLKLSRPKAVLLSLADADAVRWAAPILPPN